MEGENETNANNEKDEESNEESNEETDDKSEITNDDKEDEKIYGNNSVFTFPVCQSQENQVQETNNDVFGSFVDDSFQENTITENSENNIQQKEESTPNNSVVVDSSSFSFPTSQTNDEQQLDDQSQNTSNDFSFGSFVDSGITNTSKEQDIKETSEIEIDNEQSQPTEHLNSTLTCFPLQQNEQKQESASSEIIFDEESTSFVDKEIQENNPESPNFTFPKEEQENPSNNFSSPSFPNSKEKKEYGHESFSFGFTDPASSSKTVEDSSTKHDSEFEGIVFTKGNETNVNLSFKFTDVSDNSNTENVIEGVPSQNDKIDSENKPIENVNEFIFVDSSMKENESSERITNDGGSASINNEDIDVVEEEYQANDNEIPINSEQIAVQNSTDQPFSFDFNSGSVCDNSSFSFTFPVEGESDSNNQSSFSFTFPPECESVTTDSPNNSSFSFTFPSQESEQGNTTSNDTKNEPIQNQIVKKIQIEQKSEISENNDTHTNTMKNDVNNESTHDNGGSFNPFASPPPPTDLSKTSSEGNLKLDFSKAASTDTLFSKNGTSSSISSSLSGSSSNFNPFSTQFPAQNVSPTNYKFEDFLSMTKAPVFDVKRENLHTYFLKNDPKDSVEASFAFLLSQK
ncbi:hypothetical protein TRFO_35502 [Tritrichomonas foetus]|uniref:Uncharacterized protein n=1 Tax=Tritrichomonas foetus TaxID=1144522 RepID=A0A1J4JLI6_9EUKA|nr:hypothetical protein TRFO_35502 [Tritrichomonas foetus]|eukprot:OHS98132.1 hypothetical protein TRFO_35502 [Tritrichomonas foetus]